MEIFKKIIDEVIPAHRFLGIKVLEIEKGYAKLILPFKEEYIGDPRSMRWHGGFIATILDAVGGAAAMTQLSSSEDLISTIDMRVDYLRGGKAKDIIAEAKVVRSGNHVITTQMWAYHEDSPKHIAEGRGAFNVKRKEKK